MGSRDFAGDYTQLPGGDFDDIGAFPPRISQWNRAGDGPPCVFAGWGLLGGNMAFARTRFPRSNGPDADIVLLSRYFARVSQPHRSPSFPLDSTRRRVSRRRRAAGARAFRTRPGRREARRVVSEMQLPADDPAGCSYCGVRQLRTGDLTGGKPGRIRRWDGRTGARARGRARERGRENGQVSFVRRAAPAAARRQSGDLRRMPPGDRDA